MENKYPECEKLHAVHEESQKLGEFLTWLMSKVELATWEENDDDDTNAYMPEILVPAYRYQNSNGIQALLAEYLQSKESIMEKNRNEKLHLLPD